MTEPRIELKRIGIFSAAKTLFLLGGCGGFLLGLLQWAFFWVMLMGLQKITTTMDLPNSFELELLLGSLGGAGGIFFPVAGGFVGAVIGLVGAVVLGSLYNLAARIWGGVEFEWKEVVSSASAMQTVPIPDPPSAITPLPSAPPDLPSQLPPDADPDTDPKDDDDDGAPPRRPSSSMYE